jgi:hypothetical protein
LTGTPSACGLLLGTILPPSRATMYLRPPPAREAHGGSALRVQPSVSTSASCRSRGGSERESPPEDAEGHGWMEKRNRRRAKANHLDESQVRILPRRFKDAWGTSSAG